MRPIGSALDRALRKLGLERDVARVSALDAWPAVVRAVFGPDGERTAAVGLRERTLLVAVPDAAWAGEVRLREAALLEALHRAAPGQDIAAIRTLPARPDERVVRPSDG